MKIRQKKDYDEVKERSIKYFIQMSSSNVLYNILSKDYLQYFKGSLYHINSYQFKCELISASIFSPAILPFISNLVILDPVQLDKDEMTIVNRVQYNSLSYSFAICPFPPTLFGKTFPEAVLLTFKSSQKYMGPRVLQPSTSKPVLRMILIGVVLDKTQDNQLYVDSVINPGESYVVKEGDKAYLLI